MSYWRVILKGSIGTTEKWSIGPAFSITGLVANNPNQDLTDQMLASLINITGVGAIRPELEVLLSTQATWAGYRVELRHEDESILNIAEGNFSSALPGTGTPTKTPQDAVVISLRTATPGPKGRGRLYWPALGATLNTAFGLSAPTPAATAARAKVLIDQVATAMNSVYSTRGEAHSVRLAVRSQTDHLCRDVTSIQVGSTLDTQRRRRQDIREAYASVSYP